MSASFLISKYSRILMAALLCAAAPLAANSSTQIERGKAAAATCVACHQADGNGLALPGATAWPRLAGLDPVYLANQLRAFKSGDRNNIEMQPFANMLNDAQIDDVAVYYSSLPAKAPAASDAIPQEVLDAGRQLATSGDWDRYIVPCISCHGPGNQGIGHDFPDIAGQHAGYIASQLTAWRDGERQGDPLGLMAAIAERMNDDDITAVSAWLSTQPPADRLASGPVVSVRNVEEGAQK